MARVALSRRAFLRGAAVAGGTMLLAACGAPAVAEPTAAPVAPTPPPAAPTAGAAAAEGGFSLSPEFVLDAPNRPNGWKTTLIPPPVRHDPPVTITYNAEFSPDVKFIEGESAEDNIALRFHRETQGIIYQPLWIAQMGDAAEARWATSLAAGDLPDFITELKPSRLGPLYEADALEDITAIWERVASPRTKEWKGYPDHPIWNMARRDGRIYGVPYVVAGSNPYGNDNLLWIRQDWLTRVGAQPPKTLDELLRLGDQFLEAGLGSFGLAASSALVPNYGAWMGPLDSIFGAFGTMPGAWLEGSDGGLVFGSIQPAVRDALATLQQWYQAGFLAQDFITVNDPTPLAEPVADGRVGMIYGPAWMVGWPFPDSVANDPSAEWQVFSNITGPGGRAARRGSDLHGAMTGFRRGVDPRVVEASIQHLNWQYEREANGYDNNDYFAFIGYSLAWDGDSLTWGPSPVSLYEPGLGSQPASFHLASYGVIEDNRRRVLEREPATWNAVEQLRHGNPDSLKEAAAYGLAHTTRGEQIFNAFNGLPGPVMLEREQALQQLEIARFAEIVSGRLPLSAFDDFVAEWGAEGGQELSDEVNAWYRTTKS